MFWGMGDRYKCLEGGGQGRALCMVVGRGGLEIQNVCEGGNTYK